MWIAWLPFCHDHDDFFSTICPYSYPDTMLLLLLSSLSFRNRIIEREEGTVSSYDYPSAVVQGVWFKEGPHPNIREWWMTMKHITICHCKMCNLRETQRIELYRRGGDCGPSSSTWDRIQHSQPRRNIASYSLAARKFLSWDWIQGSTWNDGSAQGCFWMLGAAQPSSNSQWFLCLGPAPVQEMLAGCPADILLSTCSASTVWSAMDHCT